MIDFKEALRIARAHYHKNGEQTLIKIYESNEMWIFYGGREGQVKIGGAAITISKADGKVGRFILPSKANFELLKNAKEIGLEEA